MRLTSIRQLEDLGVVDYADLHVWTPAHISWRQIWYICLTVVIFWICLRFRNVGKKYVRKTSFEFQNTLLNIGPTLCYSIESNIFFRFISSLKLVYFSDFLGFKYHNCVCKENKICKGFLKIYTHLSKLYEPFVTYKLIYFRKQDD